MAKQGFFAEHWLDGTSWPEYALVLAVFMASTALGLAFAHVKWGGRR